MHPQQLRKKASRPTSSSLTDRTSARSTSYPKTRIRGSRLLNAARLLVLIELSHRLHQAYRYAYDKQAADWLLPQKTGIEFLPNGGSYQEKGEQQILEIIGLLETNAKCRRAFEIVGLQTINETLEKGIVIGPATLFNNAANNSLTGINEVARSAYNDQFARGGEAATIRNVPGQPFPFASRADQRTRMFFGAPAFSGGRAGLLWNIVHEFIHAGGQGAKPGLLGSLRHDLAGYEWYDFIQDSCK